VIIIIFAVFFIARAVSPSSTDPQQNASTQNIPTTLSEEDPDVLGYAQCLMNCPIKSAKKTAIIDECRIDCGNKLKSATKNTNILKITDEQKVANTLMYQISMCEPSNFTSKEVFDSCINEIINSNSNIVPSKITSPVNVETIFAIPNLTCGTDSVDIGLKLTKGAPTSYNIRLFAEGSTAKITQNESLVRGEITPFTISYPENFVGPVTAVGITINYGKFQGPVLVRKKCP